MKQSPFPSFHQSVTIPHSIHHLPREDTHSSYFIKRILKIQPIVVLTQILIQRIKHRLVWFDTVLSLVLRIQFFFEPLLVPLDETNSSSTFGL